jgi:integrase/recombinase XerC
MSDPSVSAAELAAARLVLARMGVSPEQLVGQPGRTGRMPTFADYIPRVSRVVSAGTRHVYEPYWSRVQDVWGDRRIDEPSPLEIREFTESVRVSVVVRRNARGGRSAVEHAIAALRCLYRHAVADDLLSAADNPALRVDKPRRLPTTRHALPDARLAEINEVAVTTGNDPALDALLLRLHTETACRRGGALALRRADLDVAQCLVMLREKGETVRWQPVSPTLMQHLVAHHDARCDGEPAGALLRFRHGRPVTRRRYDYLWGRLGKHLSWVAAQQVSTHWLRHTTLTWVERNFGYAVARAYAGHTGSDSGVTSTYIRADLPEVATALATLTGEDHPLGFAVVAPPQQPPPESRPDQRADQRHRR